MLLAKVLIVGILIFVSFIGWGWLIVKNEINAGSGMAVAYGMALACVIGGILNYLHLISPLSIQIFIGFGIISWAIHIVKFLKKTQLSENILFSSIKNNKILLSVVGTLLLITLVYSCLPKINGHDDNHAYLVFPHQMLQTGHIGEDPFNERRAGVLGGQSFLNATMLTFVPYKQIRALDGLVGLLVFITMVLTHGYRRKLSGFLLMLLFLICILTKPPAVNISSLMTATALFYAFLRRFEDPGVHGKNVEVIKTALLVASLCSLKTTNIAGLAFVGPLAFLCDRRIRFSVGLLQGIKVAAVGLLLLFPWLYAMYQSSGTFLFPLLGQGTHTSWEQGAAMLSIRMQDISWEYFKNIVLRTILSPPLCSGMLLLGLLKYKNCLQNVNPAATSAFIGAVLGTFCLSFISLGLIRYSYSFGFASFIFLAIEASRNTSSFTTNIQHDRGGKNKSWIASVVIVFFVGIFGTSGLWQLVNKITSISNFTIGALHLFPSNIVESAQKSIPSNASILAVMSHPYLMDFKRNQVFSIDHAGSAGPMQGLPVHGTAEELATYLRQQNINYIVYSYADQAGYGYKKYKHRLKRSRTPYNHRVRILAENNFKFHRQLEELTNTYKIIYKDNYSTVIDIASPGQ
jgi:hypothetical protein